MQHMSLTYLHALMMLRHGVRNSVYNLIPDAKAKRSHLFFAQSHPIYQKILYKEALDDEIMPFQLLDVKKTYISASQANTTGKTQGGDTLLEEVNKHSKSWMKMAGMRTKEHWETVFRNLDKLIMVSEICMSFLF